MFYSVTGTDTNNALVFSEFLIYFKCNTEEAKDACCMISEEHGTVCLVTSSGTVM